MERRLLDTFLSPAWPGSSAKPRTIDFLVIGAPKAGTDALRNWLNESPEAWVYGPVEPNYLCDDILGMHKDKAAWMRKVIRQAHGRQLIGEKSTWYLGSQAAISEVFARFPKARIVIMIRDNVSLFLSLHAELVKLGVEPEFDPMLAWQKAGDDPRRLDFVNTFLPNYPVSCRIGQQTARWIERFGHERVLIARIRDLETADGRRRMAGFLGLRQFLDAPAPVANKRLSAADTATTGPARRLARRARSAAHVLARGIGVDRTRPPLPGAGQVALPVSDPDFHAELTRVFAPDARLAEALELANRNHHNGNGIVSDV